MSPESLQPAHILHRVGGEYDWVSLYNRPVLRRLEVRCIRAGYTARRLRGSAHCPARRACRVARACRRRGAPYLSRLSRDRWQLPARWRSAARTLFLCVAFEITVLGG